jgi:16S rRNA (cytosine967-C5)-methyltransferase
MESDIRPLIELQSEILRSAWHMLKPGGEMLYVTCSVFKQENVMQMQDFLTTRDDACEVSIDADWGQACEYGRQILPGQYDADGFYFCRIKKNAADNRVYSA